MFILYFVMFIFLYIKEIQSGANKKKKAEERRKERDTIVEFLKQRAESVGSVESIVKRKRKEVDKLQTEEKKLGKFENTRKVTRSSVLDIEEMEINNSEEKQKNGRY